MDIYKDSSSKEMYELYDKMDQDEVVYDQKSKVYLFEISKPDIETIQKRFVT